MTPHPTRHTPVGRPPLNTEAQAASRSNSASSSITSTSASGGSNDPHVEATSDKVSQLPSSTTDQSHGGKNKRGLWASSSIGERDRRGHARDGAHRVGTPPCVRSPARGSIELLAACGLCPAVENYHRAHVTCMDASPTDSVHRPVGVRCPGEREAFKPRREERKRVGRTAWSCVNVSPRR